MSCQSKIERATKSLFKGLDEGPFAYPFLYEEDWAEDEDLTLRGQVLSSGCYRSLPKGDSDNYEAYPSEMDRELEAIYG